MRSPTNCQYSSVAPHFKSIDFVYFMQKSNSYLVLPPGLQPNGPAWTPEATLLFKSLVVVGDTPLRLYMIIVDRPTDGGALSVKLVDTTGEELNGRDVGAELATRLSTTVAGNYIIFIC